VRLALTTLMRVRKKAGAAAPRLALLKRRVPWMVPDVGSRARIQQRPVLLILNRCPASISAVSQRDLVRQQQV
jgi:hypothetical protein